MKNNMKKSILTLVMMLGCMTFCAARSVTLKVTVDNKCGIDKKSEPVVLRLNDIKKVNFTVKSASVKLDGKDIDIQMDDMDGDFETDELFWVADINAHETQVYDVTLCDDAMEGKSVVTPRIYSVLQIRDKKDLYPNVLKVEAPAESNIFNDIYMHGITIESDMVGFRIYFDERQNIDLYGKKLQRLELEKTQFYTTAEMLAEDYGTDVLWAGKAIGCGSFKRFVNNEPANWLGNQQKIRGQRIVTRGPLRTVIEVYDLGVQNTGNLFNVHQYYTLVAGHRDLKVDIRFENSTKGQQFCTGVQKVGVTATDSVRMGYGPEGMMRKDGIVASCGCDYPDMGKKQLWAPEPIAMAAYVPQKYIKGQMETDLDYLYVVEPVNGEIHYWTAFSCTKETFGYKTIKQWFDSMDSWKESLDNPVKISVK